MTKFTIGASLAVFLLGAIIRAAFTTPTATFPIDIQYLDALIVMAGTTCAVVTIYEFIVRKYPDTAEMLPLFSGIIWVVTFSSYLILRYQDTYQTSLSILVTGVFVGMGWWIQAITTAANARRTHTLNIIMASRTSTEYQTQTRDSSKLYRSSAIPQDLAEWRVNPNKDDFKYIQVPEDINDAINGTVYVLNYFEFLAQGIKFRDLDDCLLRECFCSILAGLERRGFHLIIEAQKVDPRAFEGVIRLAKDWNGESIVEKHRGNPSSAPIGPFYPDKDGMEKILNAKKHAQDQNGTQPELQVVPGPN
ncbi:DUF4760 domain-containing protein [Ectopseudomonas toyotomiensis]|uniref:DUF4760 domain-containing protein n=1 Tax=Ectopseudomonas toyotomiensis TaxID=554344 RepID=UPI003D1115A0